MSAARKKPVRKGARKAGSAAAKRPRRRKLNGLSDVRRFFYRNEEPVYVVGRTSFGLLGMDEWVGGLTFVDDLDCYDGHHPHVVSPPLMPHARFESQADVDHYLLRHPVVRDLVGSGRRSARAVLQTADGETERLCRELDLQVCLPPAKLCAAVTEEIDAIARRAGVPRVPHVRAKVGSWAELRRVARPLGRDLVIRAGRAAFRVGSERDWQRHAGEIAAAPTVEVAQRIAGRRAEIEACVTRHGAIVGPLLAALVGLPELLPCEDGWCGNVAFAEAFDRKTRARARRMATRFGEELRRMGYRGGFGLDLVQDAQGGKLYLGAAHARVSGKSALANLAACAHAEAPLFLFHLLEHVGVPYELDVDALSARSADPEFVDAWGQLDVKYTGGDARIVTAAPRTGVYAIDAEGRIRFLRAQTHSPAVRGENHAFWLRIAQEGDYLHDGADMGVLVLRGRVTDDRLRLTPRAKAWIHAVRAEYAARPVPARDRSAAERAAEVGGFARA